MSEFFCKECADGTDEVEELCVAMLGKHECVVCGKTVNAMAEPYSVFHNGALSRAYGKLPSASAPPKEAKGE